MIGRLLAWWRLFPLGPVPVRLRERAWWLLPPRHVNCRCALPGPEHRGPECA